MASLFSTGRLVAGSAPNPQTARVIADILYFQMLMVAGTTLHYEVMPTALLKAADILPLPQRIKLLKTAF